MNNKSRKPTEKEIKRCLKKLRAICNDEKENFLSRRIAQAIEEGILWVTTFDTEWGGIDDAVSSYSRILYREMADEIMKAVSNQMSVVNSRV